MNLSMGNHGTMAQRPLFSEVNIFEFVLPPQAFILLITLLILMPITLLAGESLFVPLLESVKSILIPEAELMRTTLPAHFYLKLVAFGVLTFFGVIQLILRIRQCYYQVWSHGFPRPDALHVDYQPDSQQSMLAVLNWNLYRLFVIVTPPVVIMGITVAVGFGELYLFNLFIDMSSVSLPTLIIAFLFIMFMLMMFSVFSIINGAWMALTTMFGDVVAITEPDLAANTIFDRCRRIAFSSPLVYFLYPAYVLFLILILVEVAVLLINYDIQDLVTFQVNLPAIIGLEIVTLVAYLGINYLKFFTYHHALVRYYQRLPQAFRDRFAPPPRVSL